MSNLYFNKKIFLLYMGFSGLSHLLLNVFFPSWGPVALNKKNILLSHTVIFIIVFGLFFIYWVFPILSKRNFKLAVLTGLIVGHCSGIISGILNNFYYSLRIGLEHFLLLHKNLERILEALFFNPFILLGWAHGLLITVFFYWTRKYWLKN